MNTSKISNCVNAGGNGGFDLLTSKINQIGLMREPLLCAAFSIYPQSHLFVSLVSACERSHSLRYYFSTLLFGRLNHADGVDERFRWTAKKIVFTKKKP